VLKGDLGALPRETCSGCEDMLRRLVEKISADDSV